MSTTSADFKELLSEAINQAKAKAPRAFDDLVRFSSKAGEAVASVTGGAAMLDLVPINQDKGATPIYQLQLRKVGSESPPTDLGLYSVTPTGYPISRWHSRGNWATEPENPNTQYHNVSELEEHFRWMVSSPDSRLVILVSFFQENIPSPTISAAGPT